jgi:hypothetical protein
MFSFPKRAFLLLWASSLSVEGKSLLGGRFETSTDVQSLLNLALDTADMKEADDLATKKDIYKNVSISIVYSLWNASSLSSSSSSSF